MGVFAVHPYIVDKHTKSLRQLLSLGNLEKLEKEDPSHIPGDLLFPHLNHPDPWIKTKVSRLLVKINYPGILLCFLHDLRSTQPHVRSEAARHLRDLKNSKAVPHLAERLKDSHPEVRHSSAATLIYFGKTGIRAALNVFQAANISERVGIINAFSRLPKGGLALFSMGLQDDVFWVRRETLKGLSLRKGAGSLGLLRRALKDPSALMRKETLKVMQEMNMDTPTPTDLISNSHYQNIPSQANAA